MLNAILTRVVGSKTDRDIRKLQDRVDAIQELEPELERLSDADLRARTETFRQRLGAGETVDDLLIEAFATVREAGKRTLGMRIYSVQLVGGIVLHQGKIAEMKTGEGKTLVATLPAYLNALTGKGVHIVTVNDYLASRDAKWMEPVFEMLGLCVGVIQHDMDDGARQAAYRSDITYGTNNEFGFDYLRDNMKYSRETMVQPGHHYAIVDEVDSILIDEARTPLIISGPVEHADQGIYRDLVPIVKNLRSKQNRLVTQYLDQVEKAVEKDGPTLDEKAMETLLLVKRGDPKNPRYMNILAKHPVLKGKVSNLQAYYSSQKMLSDLDEKLFCFIDERSNLVDFSEMGRDTLSGGDREAFVIPDLSIAFEKIDKDDALSTEIKLEKKSEQEKLHFERSERNHSIRQLVKAFWLFEKDVHYVVKDGQVLIVDEFTGRLMAGRRWSDGLHQAVEAKENVRIERENQTLATITFQNYFRMYGKLAGMTGTADTEALEFDKIYKLDVVVIPPNRPLRRTEFPDVVYRTMEEKFRAVIEEICELYEKGQPVLVGTITIENSERISRLLKLKKIPHVVLNAKYHEKEAEIVARAGQKGVVTIATNMAGRGTDIVLGEGVKPLGGLHILGTERHEARRIDNQLRGRAGRQGDPGSSRFYMSLEDDLMRIFGSDRISGIMQRLGMEEDVPIVHSMVTKSIERAQRLVEAHNFEIRKHLLDYDDVMNKQRNEIYRLRRELLDGKGQREYIFEKTEDVVDWLMETHAADDQDPGDWQLETMWQELFRYFGVDLRRLSSAVHDDGMGRTALRDEIWKTVREKYEEKENRYGTEKMRQQERLILLHVIDTEWKDHLLSMDHLREGIGLRGYGQRDPLVEYKREGFTMFGSMKERIEDNLLRFLFNLEMGTEQRRRDEEIQKRREQRLIYGAQAGADKASARQPKRRDAPKVGRNEPCPCGSGKKYKKCHGG